MALGLNPVVGSRDQETTILQNYIYRLSFDGDATYPAGGTLEFTDYVRAAVGHNVTVTGVVGQDCGGLTPVYVASTDALKVYDGTAEVAPGDLSLTTFDVLVICK